MKPPPFTYLAPQTTAEALTALRDHGLEAKVLAGGQSLVPVLNFRLARPTVIVDINSVRGLDAIGEDADTGELILGALVRQSDVLRSPLIAQRNPALIEAVRLIGHRTIRNRGTVGGSLAHADPAAELPLALVALGGRVKLESPRGERWLPASAFFVGYLTTALELDELLIEARFPFMPRDAGWGFEEFSRRSGDFALAAACATLTMTGTRIARCTLAIAGGGPTPIRADAAERQLEDTVADERAFEEAAAIAADACQVDADIHASEDYRRELIRMMVVRALRSAIRRCLAPEV